MSSPSWRQFAAIPFDSTVASVVRALAVEVPREGRPRTFAGPAGFLAAATEAGDWVVCEAGAARFVDSAAEVLRAAKLPTGTPSGDALRQWLRWWGWAPKSEQVAQEPQEQTRQVV